MTDLELIELIVKCLRDEAKGCEDSSFSNDDPHNSTFIILSKVIESVANRIEEAMAKRPVEASEKTPVGPNPCHYCGGEYGDHFTNCQRKQPIPVPSQRTDAENLKIWNTMMLGGIQFPDGSTNGVTLDMENLRTHWAKATGWMPPEV